MCRPSWEWRVISHAHVLAHISENQEVEFIQSCSMPQLSCNAKYKNPTLQTTISCFARYSGLNK
jgi:hypothetical protein